MVAASGPGGSHLSISFSMVCNRCFESSHALKNWVQHAKASSSRIAESSSSQVSNVLAPTIKAVRRHPSHKERFNDSGTATTSLKHSISDRRSSQAVDFNCENKNERVCVLRTFGKMRALWRLGSTCKQTTKLDTFTASCWAYHSNANSWNYFVSKPALRASHGTF